MRNSAFIAALCGLAATGVPAAAGGLETIRTDGPTGFHDGPGFDRPLLGDLEPGTGVQVTGCLSAFDWCRVIVAGLPGWLPADRLVFEKQGRTVSVASDGRSLGIPVVGAGRASSTPQAGEAVPVPPGPGVAAQPGK